MKRRKKYFNRAVQGFWSDDLRFLARLEATKIQKKKINKNCDKKKNKEKKVLKPFPVGSIDFWKTLKMNRGSVAVFDYENLCLTVDGRGERSTRTRRSRHLHFTI